MADLLPDRHRLEIQHKLGHFNSFCGHVKKVKKKKKDLLILVTHIIQTNMSKIISF